ncbi:MAG: hypothetical protein AAGA76_08150 [Pseudomonadota bacterium]
MRNLLRKIRQRIRNLRIVTAVIAILLAVAAFPWPWQFETWNQSIFIGIPLPYFLVLFVIPVFALLILIIHNNTAEDIDRHTLEFENE